LPDTPALTLPDKPSIAVLPFTNISDDPEQEYFAEEMVEEITTALSRSKWLFVIARNSSFTFKGKAVDVKEVGRRLGVCYVLEGTVRKALGKVRRRRVCLRSIPPLRYLRGSPGAGNQMRS
jgi:adenylate cyclase